MISKDFDDIIKEYFDITDTKTRKVLFAIDEADQDNILHSLTSKLYDDIVNKVDDIDFNNIQSTKGDITKIENYDQLMECIDVMRKLLIEYNQNTEPIDTIIKAIDNIKERQELFERGFNLNVELPMLTYCLIVLAIVSSISFMISSCVEYIKVPNKEEFSIAINKVGLTKTKSNLLFTNLKRFNDMCAKGQLDSVLDSVIKSNAKNFMGLGLAAGAILGAGAIIFMVKNLIPLLRELIFFFYYSRTRMADYFEIQSELLQMNAYNLDTSATMYGRTKKDISDTKNKQLKIANSFKKISNFFSIKGKETEVNTNRDLKQSSSTKYKIDDVVDSIPDSAASKSLLF